MKPGKISPILFVVLGVALGLLGFFLILANPFGWKFIKPIIVNRSSQEQEAPQGTVKAPAPTLILPKGKQTFSARTGGTQKSSVFNITYDPIDPEQNTSQTILASIQSQEPINSVTVTVNTDSQSNPHPMSLSSGTNTNGVWTTEFTVTDTYETIYNVSFEIITELGNKTTQPMLLR